MRNLAYAGKVLGRADAARWAAGLRQRGSRVVFTNGCFDILHAGHVDLLFRAAALGDALVLGLNSDASVRRLGKGSSRPVVPFEERALVLAGLACVDVVVGFDEDTPLELIREIAPDVLVKGGDWPVEAIVGAREVLQAGGRVESLELKTGLSTTRLIRRIRAGLGADQPDPADLEIR